MRFCNPGTSNWQIRRPQASDRQLRRQGAPCLRYGEGGHPFLFSAEDRGRSYRSFQPREKRRKVTLLPTFSTFFFPTLLFECTATSSKPTAKSPCLFRAGAFLIQFRAER